MIDQILTNWIAGSDSWQTAMEFELSKDRIADYPFLKRPDDFYIALIGQMFEAVNNDDIVGVSLPALVAVAKGLDVFSNEKSKAEFGGINVAINAVYVASLFYIADFPAISGFLVRNIAINDLSSDAQKFALSFLKRRLWKGDPVQSKLEEYLLEGKPTAIASVISELLMLSKTHQNDDPERFLEYRLCAKLVQTLENRSIWFNLRDRMANDQIKKLSERYYRDFNPIWSYFPSQMEAIKSGILKESGTYTLQMPTSAGKTAISELIIYHFAKNFSGKILFLAPFRALASELKGGFCNRLETMGIKCRAAYGGYIPTGEDKNSIEDVDLLIATPEKFISLDFGNEDIAAQFKLVICDEGHLLDDENRGMSYELLLSRLSSGLDSHNRKILFMSAIIPNIQDIHHWLGGDANSLVKSDYRPSEIRYGFLKKEGKIGFRLHMNPTRKPPYGFFVSKFLTFKDDLSFTNPKTKRPNRIKINSKSLASAAGLKCLAAGTVGIFTTQKNDVRQICESILDLSAKLDLPRPYDYCDTKYITELTEYSDHCFGVNYLLSVCLRNGFAFHHGDLIQEVREKIEGGIRQNAIHLIVCTNTLGEGVNLPISTLVIHTIKRFNPVKGYKENIVFRDLKNIAGRAGRAGTSSKGTIIAINEKEFSDIENIIQDKHVEPVVGHLSRITSLLEKALRSQLIELSNDLLNAQSEEFKAWLDEIDKSVADLLDIKTEDVEADSSTLARGLCSKTYAFAQASDEEKVVIENLFKLRLEYLNQHFGSKLALIREAGCPPRLLLEIETLIGEPNLTELVDLVSPEDAFDHIFSIVVQLEKFKHAFAVYVGRSKVGLTSELIASICKCWISGHWFEKIEDETGLSIAEILGIYSGLIGFDLLTLIKAVTVVYSDLANRDRIQLPDGLISLPLYLEFGVPNCTSKILTELGIGDRSAINEIGKWIIEKYGDISENRKIKSILKQEKEEILKHLLGKIPSLSSDKAKRELERFRPIEEE